MTSFLLFISPSLSFPEDINDIEELIADFGSVATGIFAIQNALKIINFNNVTQSSLITQSIDFISAVDRLDDKATATTYAIISFIGQGSDAGKMFISYGLFKDKLVKTSDDADYDE